MKLTTRCRLVLFLLLMVTASLGEGNTRPLKTKAQDCEQGTHTCHQDAICVRTRKSYRCKCKPGFNGDGKVCKDEDECLQENGGCVHTCMNTPGNYTCLCSDGFVLAPDGKDCTDKNECFDNKGGCSQQCVNTLGSFECKCASGYSLDSGGKKCVFGEWCNIKHGCDHGCRPATVGNKVECYCRTGYYLHSDGKRCLRSCELGNGGCQHKCNNTKDGPVCSCAPRYILNPDAKTCTDVDECEKKTDGCSHMCENIKGSFECVCPPGYKVSSDYKTCVDIDECIMPLTCDHKCENLPGSFQCHCKEGYQLYGQTHCADINECAVRNGNCAHTCENTNGSYTCSCNAGYKLHQNKHDCIDSKQCLTLLQQPNSDLTCVHVAPKEQHCVMTCADNAYLISEHGVLNATSLSFRCGPSSNYKWTNLEEGKLPKCSKKVTAPSYTKKASFVFIRDTCDIKLQEVDIMKKNLSDTFNSDKFKCSNSCQINTLDLMCGSKRKKYRQMVRKSRKYLITAEFELQMNPKPLTDGCDVVCRSKRTLRRFNRTLKKARQIFKRNKISLRYQNEDYKPIKKSFKPENKTEVLCLEGSQLINNTCIGCSFGTFYDSEKKKCQPCPRGTYQDKEAQTTCKECPNRKPGSGIEGATVKEQCDELCDPGTYSASGRKPCLACGIGTYQPSYGRISCLPCGAEFRTKNTGSTGFQDCLARVVCEAGYFYNTTTHSCSICPRGSYQPQQGQDFCYLCPGKTMTDFEGSKLQDDCKDRLCGHHITDFYGVLETPNYPGNYPVNVECVWKIKPESKRSILIIIPKIELPEQHVTGGVECGDSIIMRKSKNHHSKYTFQACDPRKRPIAFTAKSKKLWIQFKSDGNHTAQGFSIPFVFYDADYQTLIDDIVKDGRLYSTNQHQQIFKDRQLLTALLEVIASPYNYLKYANVSHTMFPPSFFKLLTPKVRKFFQT
ncbi:signal peptide, CUB and EGF-like domain-containing protein 1 isoform X2 [Physella acuta]|uniref:signal peptide, CUB and EGF-like domain-containing protein 1 isoform X2 n=1 Tax=Physella acuta TaxID=109671 RepID=UPI0027DDC62C|nr:signal peptide, CUB and EGF-like domain-containing protein 1 isoform X2 [Physella acuta]